MLLSLTIADYFSLFNVYKYVLLIETLVSFLKCSSLLKLNDLPVKSCHIELQQISPILTLSDCDNSLIPLHSMALMSMNIHVASNCTAMFVSSCELVHSLAPPSPDVAAMSPLVNALLERYRMSHLNLIGD